MKRFMGSPARCCEILCYEQQVKCTLPYLGGFVKDSNFHTEELLKVIVQSNWVYIVSWETSFYLLSDTSSFYPSTSLEWCIMNWISMQAYKKKEISSEQVSNKLHWTCLELSRLSCSNLQNTLVGLTNLKCKWGEMVVARGS
jgi:hypothetical protein